MAYVATTCLALAVVHTFLVSYFRNLAQKYPEGSPSENFFHLLSEVEVTFGLWAGVFITFMFFLSGTSTTVQYLEKLRFTEPIFVFAILTICSTRPILEFAYSCIRKVSSFIPINKNISLYISTLTIGPLLGSLITEPAAMTVTTLILIQAFFEPGLSKRLMYATIGLLFVNISIGGTLTPFAAPPVLMVARKWDWDLAFMMQNFGWKAFLSCLIGSLSLAYYFRNELKSLKTKNQGKQAPLPTWVIVTHLLFLLFIVLNQHHTILFLGIFMFYLGLYSVTQEYQSPLKLREGFLVAFFLAGIVVLGDLQKWWLEPALSGLDNWALYLGSNGLTAITDNAALAYLGSQIESLTDSSRYAMIAGSVVGGGLTVIANAPNPVGYGLLNGFFGKNGIHPLGLMMAALPFTVLAALLFWIF